MKLIFGFPDDIHKRTAAEQIGYASLAGLQVLAVVLICALLICMVANYA